MKNAKNRPSKKMILRLSKCEKVLLMSNDKTKEKEVLPLSQLESVVSLKASPFLILVFVVNKLRVKASRVFN